MIHALFKLTLFLGLFRSYTSTEGGYIQKFPFYYSLHVEKVIVQDKKVYHPVENVIELDSWGQPKPYILISHTNNLTVQPVDEFVADSSECDEVTDKQGEKIIIAGIEGRIFRNVHCNSRGETRVYAVNDKTGYNFIFNGEKVDEATIKMILDNFELIKKKP